MKYMRRVASVFALLAVCLAGVVSAYNPDMNSDHIVDVQDVFLLSQGYSSLYGMGNLVVLGKFFLLDTTPPSRSDASPQGVLPSDTTSVLLGIITDEVALCRFSTIPGTPFEVLVEEFTSVDGFVHQYEFVVQGESSYSFFVRCADASGNQNADDVLISFVVGEGGGEQWIETGLGYRLRAEHPRSIITSSELEIAKLRAVGSFARDPYKRWFERVVEQEVRCQAQPSNNCPQSLMGLAIMYWFTQNDTYREWYLDLLSSSLYSREPGEYSGVGIEEIATMDMLWEDVPDTLKIRAYELSSPHSAFYWASGSNSESQSFGYHGAHGRFEALAFAVVYAFDPILSHPTVISNPDTYSFNTSLYIQSIKPEFYPGGLFYDVERRIAGDPTFNPVVEGDYGGMYDNFGYDASEEAYSVHLLSVYQTATGEQVMDDFLHDKYRGRFYQLMGNPSMTRYAGSGENAHKTSEMVRIWYTQVNPSLPNRQAVALTASKYQDPHMQYFANIWRKLYDIHTYHYFVSQFWWYLFYYDDSLPSIPPEENPTSMYFNGPGLVSMRSSWDDDSTFAVFVCGEGISRRYEDGNSFILYSDGPVFIHAGARIRNNYDNSKNHWFHLRSISKNTFKVFDPNERFDVLSGGRIGEYGSGTHALVPSDNLGGMVFETFASVEDKQYTTWGGISRGCGSQRDGECEAGNMLKYEYIPDVYTYSVGDAAVAYTEKIDVYIREFVFVHPDVFILFDRVRSRDPSFKKAWVGNTVYEPVVHDEIVDSSNGMNSYLDARSLSIDNRRRVTHMHTLLPEENKVIVRGGDTVLTASPLRPGTPILEHQVLESDIPRWLELFALGPDVVGSVTITGDALEGVGVSETVEFDGTYQVYETSSPTSVSNGVLVDENQLWEEDQWVGYYVGLRGGEGGDHLITSNTHNTLFVENGFSPSGVWGYYIRRPLANSLYHWQSIASITTSNMDVDTFIVSTPHYFDAQDVLGRVESFAPKTDSKSDVYRKNPGIGQWNVNIEARVPRLHDNFLNVLYIADSGEHDIPTRLVRGEGFSGVVVNESRVFFFSDEELSSQDAEFIMQGSDMFEFFVFNLLDNQAYSIFFDDTLVTTTSSSDMGVVRFSSHLDGEVVLRVVRA